MLCLSVTQLKAQGTPCGDPDLDCPIDTPVIFLAAAMLFLAVKKMIAANNPQKEMIKKI